PGLGSSEVNTDFGLAISNQTKRQFKTLDYPPFQAAIAAHTDSIMMSHLVAPALDPSRLPASLSKPIVTGILRKQLGYTGMVITDALDAQALNTWTPAQLAVKAFRAGNDMLLMSGNLPQAIDALKSAVRSGSISRTRLNASVRRILQLKYNNGILDHPWSAGPAGVAATVGSPAHLATMQDVSNKSVTLVTRSAPGAPLHPGSNVLLTGYGAIALPAIDGLLAGRGATVQRILTGMNPAAGDVAAAVAAAPGHDAVVIITYNAWANPGQQQLIAQMLATGVPVIVGMISGPYDAALATNARAVLALYSGSFAKSSQVTFVNVLFGQQPLGRLPVTVPSLTNPQQVVFPYGTGLRWS
ncbi:MAG: glycoside hydrolase family 3 N-terminal domain-containing protein, partial [Actinomycetes bacterium]